MGPAQTHSVLDVAQVVRLLVLHSAVMLAMGCAEEQKVVQWEKQSCCLLARKSWDSMEAGHDSQYSAAHWETMMLETPFGL